MKEKSKELFYEIFNSVSHGVGVIIGIIFLVMLIIKNYGSVSKGEFIGYVVYGAGFIFMFLSSSVYHGVQNKKLKQILRVFDHSAIFLFIAGSYTPIMIKVLEGSTRWIFLTIIWSVAVFGLFFKLYTYGKYDRFIKVSVFLYIVMGWMSLLIIKPMILNTTVQFLSLIIVGGLLYTVGTYFYKKKSKMYNHIIWHFFVLAASICHFIAIYEFL